MALRAALNVLRDSIETGRMPLQHLQVPVRIAGCEDRLAADEAIDANGLACTFIDEVNFRKSHQYGLAVRDLEPCLDAAADHLLRRDTIDTF